MEAVAKMSPVEACEFLKAVTDYLQAQKRIYAERYYESDIADGVYDMLFSNNCDIDFIREFPDAEVNYEFAYIKLNDEFVIKIERI